jgi:hypothetical protein
VISCLTVNALNMLDAGACRAWWLRRLHPAGAACPGCGVIVEGLRLERWQSGGRLHCADCGKWFDNQTGTPLDHCRADWKQLTVIASLIPLGLAPAQVALICRLSDDTVRRIAKRLHLGAPSERRFIVCPPSRLTSYLSAEAVRQLAGTLPNGVLQHV